MKKFGLLGNNIGYSLSPKIHSYIYKKLGVEGEYSLYQSNAQDLEKTVEVLKELSGFNVTQPHKKNIITYLDRNFSKFGAVNTVKIKDNKLYGYNTDYNGFKAHMLRIYKDFDGAVAVIEGAGGMAQIAAIVLKELGSDVYITNRTIGKAVGLAQKIGVKVLPENEIIVPVIYVNCSSQGLEDESYNLPKGIDCSMLELAYDSIYFETAFLREARLWQCPVCEKGLYMLAMQAIYAAEIFLDTRIEDKNELCDEICEEVTRQMNDDARQFLKKKEENAMDILAGEIAKLEEALSEVESEEGEAESENEAIEKEEPGNEDLDTQTDEE